MEEDERVGEGKELEVEKVEEEEKVKHVEELFIYWFASCVPNVLLICLKRIIRNCQIDQNLTNYLCIGKIMLDRTKNRKIKNACQRQTLLLIFPFTHCFQEFPFNQSF